MANGGRRPAPDESGMQHQEKEGLPRTMPFPLTSMNIAELQQLTAELGFPPYRGRQLFHWLYRRRVESVHAMHNLPHRLRQILAEQASIPRLALAGVRTDGRGTTKVLFSHEGESLQIESVFIQTSDRTTACLSSQIGCGRKCQFCVTGQLRLRGNLQTWEILEQLWAMERHSDRKADHVVFMGMGEPFDNWPAVSRALEIMTHPRGMALAPRRITVSTAGVVPGIRNLAKEHPKVRLAISLVAPHDSLRDVLMPINQRYPLEQLLDAARCFSRNRGDKVTFEYPLLAGVNDSLHHARTLGKLLRGIKCKVNLIPFNESPLLPFERPAKDVVEAFRHYLTRTGIVTTVRYSAGTEVQAACGQLVYLDIDEPGKGSPC